MNKLLEDIVETKLDEFLLKEDEANDIGGDIQTMGSMMSLPAYHGGPSPLRFVWDAMKDVIDTGVAGIKNISLAGQGLLKTAFSFVNDLINPYAENPNYDGIMSDTMRRIRSVNRHYADVYKRNIDALTTGDTFGLMFLLNPSAMITIEAISAAPAAAFSILNVLTGGLLEKGIRENRKHRGEHGLYEEDEKADVTPTAQEILDALKKPAVKSKFDQATKVTREAALAGIQDYATRVVQKPIETAIQQSLPSNNQATKQDIMSVKTALTQKAIKDLSTALVNKLSH